MICSLKDSTVHGISQAGSGLPFPTPGNLLDLGIKAESLASPALAGRCFTVVPPGKPKGLVQLAYKTFCYFFFFLGGIYGHPAYLTYMQGTSCEMSGWMKHKLESRLPGKISITSDVQMTPPLWQKAKKN